MNTTLTNVISLCAIALSAWNYYAAHERVATDRYATNDETGRLVTRYRGGDPGACPHERRYRWFYADGTHSECTNAVPDPIPPHR